MGRRDGRIYSLNPSSALSHDIEIDIRIKDRSAAQHPSQLIKRKHVNSGTDECGLDPLQFVEILPLLGYPARFRWED